LSTKVGWVKLDQPGSPLRVKDMTVTPMARVIVFQTPWGGWVWNRPVAVMVEREGLPTERLPVSDVTRWFVWGLGLLSLVFLFGSLGATLFKRRRG